MKMKYVAYIRVANEDDWAIENQKNIIDVYAESKDFKIDKYYIDNGYSGTKLDRPQLRQLLRDVKSKNITTAIVVKDLSRLARGSDLVHEIVHRISKRNVRLISTIESETELILSKSLLIDMYRKWQLPRKISGQRLLDENIKKGKYIVIPFAKDTKEDIEIREREIDKALKEGIHVKFVNKPQKRKGVHHER